MYAEYLKEREGKNVLENEHGFVVFKYFDEFTYIIDIYVKPEMRKSHVASVLANEVCAISKALGKKQILGSVDVRANGATDSLKVLLAYGMHVDSIDGQVIYFKKDIGG
jgi:Acetyltransferase (GNAT) family